MSHTGCCELAFRPNKARTVERLPCGSVEDHKMLGVPEGVGGPATVYVGLITSKRHRDQLQGTPLSLSPHERATKDQQSREKLLNVDIDRRCNTR